MNQPDIELETVDNHDFLFHGPTRDVDCYYGHLQSVLPIIFLLTPHPYSHIMEVEDRRHPIGVTGT